MKKIAAFFTAFFLIFSMPVLFAQMPLGVPAAPGISQDLAKIGVVAAAGGKVELTTPGQVGRIAQSGQAIFMGDEVKTDAEGHLQILLLDETVFTIGPNSAIVVDKFVYDPKSHTGEIKASITKGVFRYVSGKIAAKNPDSVKVKLPTATLGFRGTIVGGSVGADGQGLTALLGPGDNNDSGAQAGSFTVNGDGGGQQEVNRTGFGVEIGADGGVSNVFQLSDNQMNGLTGGLGGGQGGGNQSGGGQGGGNQGGGQGGGLGGGDSGSGLGGNTDMGALSGENNVLGGNNVTLAGGLGNISDNMGNVSTLGAQNALDESGAQEALDNSGGNSGGEIIVNNATTTYEQLQTASGSGHYAATGSYSGGNGGYTFAQADIVFGPGGSIGSINSYVAVSDGTYADATTSSTLGEQFIGSGPASFSWNEPGTFGTFTIAVTLTNDGAVIAQTATANVTYTNTNGEIGPVNGTGTVTATLTEGALAA